ncbi:hypothetical protein, partial [Desulfosarcina cetonica]|uniref:hypothetical protein n=1 Tax=Desulfosarcina cetonica TaxID=90730 RepID=UPI0012ED1872
MTPAYMPFTYLSTALADTLAALVGPLVIYQPMADGVSENLTALDERGTIAIRVPLSGDEDRLAAALAEFTRWARLNPGKSTAGAGFISSRQGMVPFFDETTINQLRTDIQQYGRPDAGSDAAEVPFSARLFLAVAQNNDSTTDHLDDDLSRFKAMEQKFLDSLDGADDVAFNRHGTGAELWREDPGARQTVQRIRAWATLAAADTDSPDLLVTTSAAVVDTLMERFGDTLALETLATIRLGVPQAGDDPLLAAVLA